jgi:hypothetical protein
MNSQDFDALLARRDELQRKHDTACAILEEEGPRFAHINLRKCGRIYDELAAVQARIDDEIAAERAAANGD